MKEKPEKSGELGESQETGVRHVEACWPPGTCQGNSASGCCCLVHSHGFRYHPYRQPLIYLPELISSLNSTPVHPTATMTSHLSIWWDLNFLPFLEKATPPFQVGQTLGVILDYLLFLTVIFNPLPTVISLIIQMYRKHKQVSLTHPNHYPLSSVS